MLEQDIRAAMRWHPPEVPLVGEAQGEGIYLMASVSAETAAVVMENTNPMMRLIFKD